MRRPGKTDLGICFESRGEGPEQADAVQEERRQKDSLGVPDAHGGDKKDRAQDKVRP